MSEPAPSGRQLFDEHARAKIAVALDAQVPGAADLGAVTYVERLLTAMDHEPPRIWAAPDGSTEPWLELGVWERAAWTTRIAELQALYDRVVTGETTEPDRRVLHAHACEATYGDPAYGGNRDRGGWQRVGFPDPMFPPARAKI